MEGIDTDGTPPVFRIAIDYERRGGASVRLLGELDVASVARVRRLLSALSEEPGRVAIDLRGLRFVDVPGARLLMELDGVAGATGQVARVLELASARFLPPMATAA